MISAMRMHRVYCVACGVTDQRRAKWLLRIAIERGGIATMQHLRNCHGNMLGVVRSTSSGQPKY